MVQIKYRNLVQHGLEKEKKASTGSSDYDRYGGRGRMNGFGMTDDGEEGDEDKSNKYSQEEKDKERCAEVLLAYRNDIEPHWYLALVEHEEAQKKKKPKFYSQFFGGGDSDDEDEDATGKREWVFIKPDGQQVLRHAGDTIIPGAGVRWKHLHRALPLTDVEKMEKLNKAAEKEKNLNFHDADDASEKSAEDADDVKNKTVPVMSDKTVGTYYLLKTC